MNFNAEIMEEFGVELAVTIRYLDEKYIKNYIFKLNFMPFLKLKKGFETLFGNSSHVDFKNGIRIEFSSRNDGKIGWWSGCKIQHLYEKMEKNRILTWFLYTF